MGPDPPPQPEAPAVLAGGPTVRVVLGAATVPVDRDEDLLTALLRRGVRVPYGCRHGNCGRCRHNLLAGEVEQTEASPYSLTPSDRAAGAILLCRSRPLTDVVIEAAESRSRDDELPTIPPQDRNVEVVAVDTPGPGFAELRVRIDQTLRFRAGQYVELGDGEGLWRSFCVATQPELQPELAFLVKRRADGRFSARLDHLRPGDTLRLRGPFGSLSLPRSGRPLVMLAEGAGVAPVVAMLTEAGDRRYTAPITMVYAAPPESFVPYSYEIGRIANTLPRFHPVCCCPENGSTRSPFRDVLARVARLETDPSDLDAIVVGDPRLCDAATDLLEARGVPTGRIRSEGFYAADPPQP